MPIYTAANTAAIGEPIRVFIDDVDVTRNCDLVDTDKGYARCLVRDEMGQLLIENNEFVTECLRGVIRIERINK